MKKSIVWSVLIALVLCGINSFAQFGITKNAVKGALEKAALNRNKLRRFVDGATLRAPNSMVPSIAVPERILEGKQYVTLETPAMPEVGDKVNASYLYKHQEVIRQAERDGIRLSKEKAQEILTRKWLIGQKAFYEDGDELARALNEDYKGRGIEVAVGNKVAKLYALPADGILYKPLGYTEPVVLTAQDNFVVYYPKTKTGQIVENTPANRQIFSRPANNTSGGFDELVTLGGRDFWLPMGEQPKEELVKAAQPQAQTLSPKQDMNAADPSVKQAAAESAPAETEFDPWDELDGEVPEKFFREATPEEFEELTRLNNQAREEILKDHPQINGRFFTNEELYGINRYKHMNDMEGAKKAEEKWTRANLPTRFSSQTELAQALRPFQEGMASKVKDMLTWKESEVYEIPVKGLRFEEADGSLIRLDPASYVVLHNERTGGQLVRRRILEDQQLFRFVR